MAGFFFSTFGLVGRWLAWRCVARMICSSWLGKHRAGLKGFLAGDLQRIVLRDLHEQFWGLHYPWKQRYFQKSHYFIKLLP